MIRVGILFGGSSREREVSFSGGRTVYDNLDKSVFEAVPIFVDSFNQLILLDWSYIYKGSIRDFYPPIEYLPASPHAYQIYADSLAESLSPEEKQRMGNAVGKVISPSDLPGLIDIAFLALHGFAGEDGSIQGLLEWYGIPYTGSGLFASAFGIDKSIQKKLFSAIDMPTPAFTVIEKQDWLRDEKSCADLLKKNVGFPCVIKAANQGSSIGISVVSDEKDLAEAVEKAFFRKSINSEYWSSLSESAKTEAVRSLSDIREGLGLPLFANGTKINHPEDLLTFLNKFEGNVLLEALDGENTVVAEAFIEGREFSCIVIRNTTGKAVALPPTEIVKGKEIFDYRSKYLPGLSRKITPINLPKAELERIRKECEKLFELFGFNVYARIDGFYGKDGKIFLNDPNTTSGMMPSSFFFHQAAEIGLRPSAFLSYLIETSLEERIRKGTRTRMWELLAQRLKTSINRKETGLEKKNIAVIMGGYSSERHISVESGRNIFEKLASSVKYEPIPVFLAGDENHHRLFLLPVNIMLKDNADDIKEKVLHFEKHPLIAEVSKECEEITKRYAAGGVITEPREISFNDLAQMADAVFIALHGRPGEDGALQQELEKVGLTYNGSGTESSQITINKYETNRILEQHGLLVAPAILVTEEAWLNDKADILKKISEACGFPLIAKPSDDGCSSAVKKIDNEEELEWYAQMLFRKTEAVSQEIINHLKLNIKEEIPRKKYFLVEQLIQKEGAKHFLEITGGLLTHINSEGNREYEIFEPSEALAEKGILSLEEKFLAGQGQNITPARFSRDAEENQKISRSVRQKLKEAAKVLNIEGYARIDAFVRIFENGETEVIFIEVNSLPGMTPATCIFHQTAINGYKPYEFIDKILEYGMRNNSIPLKQK